MFELEQLQKKIAELTDNLFKEEYIELIALEVKPHNAGLLLRFLVDRQGGITIEECSQINRRIGKILDETDLLDMRYMLEVSSPGADRDLVTRTDFWLNVGRRLRIVLKEPVDGKMTCVWLLKSVKEQNIIFESECGVDVTIALDNIIKAKQEIKI